MKNNWSSYFCFKYRNKQTTHDQVTGTTWPILDFQTLFYMDSKATSYFRLDNLILHSPYNPTVRPVSLLHPRTKTQKPSRLLGLPSFSKVLQKMNYIV